MLRLVGSSIEIICNGGLRIMKSLVTVGLPLLLYLIINEIDPEVISLL